MYKPHFLAKISGSKLSCTLCTKLFVDWGQVFTELIQYSSSVQI